VTTDRSSHQQRWERWLQRLPLALLLLATTTALATGPATGATAPLPRLLAQLALVVVTAGWLVRWFRLEQQGPQAVARGAVHYVVRSVLALALTLLNPLFCIFAWVGFLDAADIFRGRRLAVALGATAFTMAAGQAGGFPPASPGQGALFLVLLMVNFGLASVLSRYSQHVASTSDERAVAISELERVNASLEQALAENESLQGLVATQAHAAGIQEERQRLAREIHDTIAQSLAGILAQLQAAQEGPAAEVGARIDRSVSLAREALVEARRSVMDLAPAALTEGLTDAAAAVVRDWNRHHPSQWDMVVTGDARPLHPEVEATVLRVLQEALTNAARHARATRVGVTLSYLDDEVVLDVRDDGAGFDAHDDHSPSSFGLRGMRQRAARLAGVLHLETEPGDGTTISMRLPALERGAM
jgi:signal transduction histidine kinase